MTPEVRILAVLVGDMSRRELQHALELQDSDHFRLAYLQPALAAGWIEMTIPDKPKSPRQKYRTTQAGLALQRSMQESKP